MSSKVDKIKGLQQDLRKAAELATTLKQKINAQSRTINGLRDDIERRFLVIDQWSTEISRTFEKEFMWLKLQPTQKSSPFHSLKKTLYSMGIATEHGLKGCATWNKEKLENAHV